MMYILLVLKKKDLLENEKSYILSKRQSIHRCISMTRMEGYAFFYIEFKETQVKY